MRLRREGRGSVTVSQLSSIIKETMDSYSIPILHSPAKSEVNEIFLQFLTITPQHGMDKEFFVFALD